MSKVVKTAGNDDTITIASDDDADTLGLKFESPNGERESEYQLKLMDIDSEHLGIPDTQYDAVVKMPSNEFQRICRDLLILNESVNIDVTKEGIRFMAQGDLGTGSTLVKPGGSVDKEDEGTTIDLQQPVQLTFSLKYLSNFTKATPLASQVSLSMSADVPLLVEYKVGCDHFWNHGWILTNYYLLLHSLQVGDVGYLRFYLAPKVGCSD